MTPELIILVTTFFAAFSQGVAGFGFGLITMPVLSELTSIYAAAPLVALGILTNNTMGWIIYRRSFDRKVVVKLLLGSALGIPFGFLALHYIPAAGMLIGLGLMIVAYALYSFMGPIIPIVKSPIWTYSAGFAAGLLTGGYTLPGPAVVLYGNSQRWSQETFKSNLCGFFWVNSILVACGHGLQHRISGDIIHQFVIIIPGLIIGLFLGICLSKYFNPFVFRRVVLAVLTVVGIRLIFLGAQA